MAPTGPPEAARLYGVALEEFVEERDALARELRDEGRREEAERVRKLRRPSLALWTVNRLARERESELRPLVEAGEQLRQGKGEAADEIAAGVDRLVRSARELVEEAGRKPSDATLQQVASILRAAVADETRAAELSAGALTEEPEAAGFDAMAALAGTAPRGRRWEAGNGKHRRERLQEARKALADAQARAKELRRAADAAEREARRARAESDRAEAEAERAERKLEDATRDGRAR